MFPRKRIKERILALFYYTPPVPHTSPDTEEEGNDVFVCMNEWLSWLCHLPSVPLDCFLGLGLPGFKMGVTVSLSYGIVGQSYWGLCKSTWPGMLKIPSIGVRDQVFCLGLVWVFLPFFFFLRVHLQHMEIPRLGVKSELQLPAHTAAIGTWVPSLICNLPHSSRQCQMLNPLCGARDQTSILMDISCAKPQRELPGFF